MKPDKEVVRVAVRAVITDDNNRALIIKRGNTHYGNDKWCIPGGKADHGIPVTENLVREIDEETGLNCHAHEFLFYLDTLPSAETDLHFVSLVFYCRVTGELSLNEESSEYAWVSEEDLEKYEFVFDNDKALRRYWGS